MRCHVPLELRPLVVSPPPLGHWLRVPVPGPPAHPAMAALTRLQLVAVPHHLPQREVTDHRGVNWLWVPLLYSVRSLDRFGLPQVTQHYKMDNFAW